MSAPQPGIFALGTRAVHHLEFSCRPGLSANEIRDHLAKLNHPNVAAGATNKVIGFGPDLWSLITPSEVPAGLAPFETVEGINGHRAPSTQGDIWMWVHGSEPDEVIDTVRAVCAVLDPIAELTLDAPSFVYHDSRDMTGFIDGTANPTPPNAPSVALVPDGQPGEGGSHVLVQRWKHNLAAFEQLDVSEQEEVFGRSKLDSVAIPKPVRPKDAHISRAEVLDAQGEEREMYRRSTAWADAEEQGLMFLAFCSDRSLYEVMIERMYGLDSTAIQDRLLDFTNAVSGSYYFAPSVTDLQALDYD